jgi:hypothetical protein
MSAGRIGHRGGANATVGMNRFMVNTSTVVDKVFHRIDPQPGTLARFHFAMMNVWALLAIPTVLFWKQSILWVAFMSLYANFVGHFSGWDAARAEKKADDDN